MSDNLIEEYQLDEAGVAAAVEALDVWSHDFREPMARAAIAAYLKAARHDERHPYVGNWPYEPCGTCGRSGLHASHCDTVVVE